LRPRSTVIPLAATSFGVGRLLIREQFATGLQVGHAWSLGQWDASGNTWTATVTVTVTVTPPCRA